MFAGMPPDALLLFDSTSGCLLQLTHRNEILIADVADVIRHERQKGLGSPRGGHELDFESVWSVDIHDGPKVASAQTCFRHVTRQYNGIQKIEHGFTSGKQSPDVESPLPYEQSKPSSP